MKGMRMIVVFCFLCSYQQINAQFDFGVMFGLSTMDVSAEELSYSIAGKESFSVLTRDARYGIQLGAFLQLQYQSFFIMPEAYLHSIRYDHQLEELNSTGEVIQVLRSEDLHSFDIGLLLGKKWGFFRLGAGPVASMYLDSVSQLWAENGYDQSWDTVTWGAQLGAGLDILMIHVDLRYQLDLEKYGDHIKFFGQQAKLSGYAGRWSLRLGYSF